MSARGEYRAIHTVMLDGGDFQALSPDARLCLFTVKMDLGASGIDVLYQGTLEAHTGLNRRRLLPALAELADAGWIRADGNIMWLVRGLEFEPTASPLNYRHRTGIRAHIAGLPRRPIVAAFRAHYPAWFEGDGPPSSMPSEAPSEPTPIPLDSLSKAMPVAIDSQAKQEVGSRKYEVGSRKQEVGIQTTTATDSVELHSTNGTRQPAPIPSVEVATKKRQHRDDYEHAIAGFVFSYWAARTGHTGALLDARREARILARLRESNGNPNDLLYAVDGAVADDFLSGRSPRAEGKRYDGVLQVFRDREKVEVLADARPGWARGEPHPKLAEIPAMESA